MSVQQYDKALAAGISPTAMLENIASHEKYYRRRIAEEFPSRFLAGFGWTGRNCGGPNGAYRRSEIRKAIAALREIRSLRSYIMARQ